MSVHLYLPLLVWEYVTCLVPQAGKWASANNNIIITIVIKYSATNFYNAYIH